MIEAMYVCILILIIFSYWGFPWLIRCLYGHLLKADCIRHRALVLTFDDGPGSQLTLKILDLLAQENIKATFLLLGRNIAGREDIVRRIAHEGHEIASHSYGHLHAWKEWPWKIVNDVRKGNEAIGRAVGTTNCRYAFRPPYGKLNLVSLVYLWIKRIPIYYWTLDSGDTWPGNRRKSRLGVFQSLKQGEVILLHDFDHEINWTEHIDYVLEATKASLAAAQKVGLEIYTMEQLKKTALCRCKPEANSGCAPK
jgi:peptidoglycan/xylan/chitin deacetylase (PgdA/CDA1 family)